MREVSARAYLMLRDACARLGVPASRLTEGIEPPIDPARLTDPDARLDWDQTVALFGRAGELLGLERMEEVGALGVHAAAAMPLRAAAHLLGRAAPIYRLGVTWWAPSILQHMQFNLESLPDGRLRIRARVPEPYRESPEILRVGAGVLRAVPRLIGQSEARIDVRYGPRDAEFLVEPPKTRALVSRARRALRILLSAETVLDELAAQERHLYESRLAVERLMHDFRRVIEGLPDGVVIHRDGTIVYANPAWHDLTGAAEGSLAGSKLTELLHPEEPARTARPFLGAGPGGRGGQLRLLRSDGRELLLEVAAAQPVEFDGPALLLSARDITERRRAQVQLALADRMVSVGTLAAGVAHEINNPLAYVLANLRLVGRALTRLRDRLPDGEARVIHEMLDDAREGAERVREIVNHLGAFARSDDRQIGRLELAPLLERALKLAEPETKHRARVVRELHTAPPVAGNEVRLVQVFLDLLTNAARAIPPGRADENRITVFLGAQDGRAVVRVSDTGHGVAPEHRARIFDPFFSTRPVGAGSGLGLSVAHAIVTDLGGSIGVADADGGGSVFTVELPAITEAVPEAPARPLAAAGQPAQRRSRVLIIDDEPRVAAALTRALEEHEVSAVRSGAAALELLASGPDYDLILCDLMMPELGGMEFHGQLRARHPGMERRIVFMTGGAYTRAASEFLARVGNPCLQKPFRLEELMSLLARAPGEGAVTTTASSSSSSPSPTPSPQGPPPARS